MLQLLSTEFGDDVIKVLCCQNTFFEHVRNDYRINETVNKLKNKTIPRKKFSY